MCDAFGVEKIIFSGITEDDLKSRKVTRISRSTEKYIDYSFSEDISKYLKLLKETHQIIGLEITSDSFPVSEYSFDLTKPIALVIGDEIHGVSENVLTICDNKIHIEMYGNNSSMNVIQATNIAIYEMVKQVKENAIHL